MLTPWMKYFVRFLQYLVFLMIWPYSVILAFCTKKKTLPPVTNPLLFHSATMLAEMIRNQKVSSVQVVEAYIERINAVNPIINSMVDQRFKAALQDALAVDNKIKDNPNPDFWAEKKPLLGVPISIKESLGVTGLSNNGGRPVPKEQRAKKDAVVVANLREAGAIPLLVTNTPELCLFWETFNSVHGITRNPYNVKRSAGGSSGGECALIASAGSVIGVGSDIVGSGRIPALFCGVFGHKPTPGILSVDGHMPMSEDPEWCTFLTVSPLCRYAEDISLIMKGAAPEAAKILRLDEQVDIKKIRVFYMEEHKCILTNHVQDDVRKSIRKAISYLKTRCEIQPQKVDFKEFDDSLEAVCTLMLRMKSPETIFQKSENLEDWTTCDVIKMLLKRLVGLSKHTMHAIFFGAIKKIAESLTKEREEDSRRFKKQWQKKFEEMLGEDGVFIFPTFPHTANYHYQLYYKMTDSSYLSTCNLLEMASTACPMGFTESGLPVGFQVIACKRQDRLTIAVAKELEAAFGGWALPGTTRNKRVLTNEV